VTAASVPGQQPRYPGVQHLHAAWWLKDVLNAAGMPPQELRQSLGSMRTDGLYTQEVLLYALDLLASLGLVEHTAAEIRPTQELLRLHCLPEPVFAELLLQRFVRARELWLPSFAPGESRSWAEIVPLEADQLLAGVYENAQRREGVIRALACKVDAQALAELGCRGEEAVVQACRAYLSAQGRPDLADQVRRVSEYDDTLGYDVFSPDCRGGRHEMEVKTTRAPRGRVEFFLSRHEAEIGATDPDWSLTVVREELDNGMTAVGWLRFSDIEEFLPRDSDATVDGYQCGRWDSVRIRLPDLRLLRGLPISAP
jgi:hypothetical protein